MKKINSGPSLYHVSDKAISDGLEKISELQMTHFLRRKGIFVSSETQKEDLIKYIRTINFGFSDFLWLTKLLENPNKKVRTEVTRLDIKTSTENLKDIANTIKQELRVEDINCSISKNKDTVKIELNYIEENLNVSELKQKQIVKSEIEITNNNDSIGFSFGSIPTVKGIKDKIIKKIKEETNNNDIEPVEISLQYITDPEVRSRFFLSLTEGIDGYNFDDILSVNVTKNFKSPSENEEDEAEDAQESHIAAIRNAALNGISVTNTPSFSQLHEDGYYIYKIVWSSIEDILDGLCCVIPFRAEQPYLD